MAKKKAQPKVEVETRKTAPPLDSYEEWIRRQVEKRLARKKS